MRLRHAAVLLAAMALGCSQSPPATPEFASDGASDLDVSIPDTQAADATTLVSFKVPDMH